MSSDLERALFVYVMHYMRCEPDGKMKPCQSIDAIEARISEYDRVLGTAVDDLYDVIEWLREDRHFAQSDRVRVITGRLARVRRESFREPPDFIRTIARSWRDPIDKKVKP